MRDLLAEAVASNITYSVEEAIQEITYELRDVEAVPCHDPDVSKCLLLVSDAGMGKSSLVRQAAERAGALFLPYHHGAAVEEDLHGLPKIVNGVAVNAPAHFIAPAIDWEGGCRDKPIALFVDEIFSGQGAGHQNFARMIIDRKYNSLKLLPNVRIIAATNPETADYGTVRTADHALSDRMIILPVKATIQERLQYWGTRMHSQNLYKFLLMQRESSDSIITFLSSRAWMNLSHTLAIREACGANRATIIKLVTTATNNAIAMAYNAFLENGNDPDKYPICARELFRANDKELGLLIERVAGWCSSHHRSALIGATKWDICAYLRKQDNINSMSAQALRNLGVLCAEIGPKGYASLVEDILATIAGTTIITAVLQHLDGTPAGDKLKELFTTESSPQASVGPTATKLGVTVGPKAILGGGRLR